MADQTTGIKPRGWYCAPFLHRRVHGPGFNRPAARRLWERRPRMEFRNGFWRLQRERRP